MINPQPLRSSVINLSIQTTLEVTQKWSQTTGRVTKYRCSTMWFNWSVNLCYRPPVLRTTCLNEPVFIHDKVVWIQRFHRTTSINVETRQNRPPLQDCLSSENFYRWILCRIILQRSANSVFLLHLARHQFVIGPGCSWIVVYISESGLICSYLTAVFETINECDLYAKIYSIWLFPLVSHLW